MLKSITKIQIKNSYPVALAAIEIYNMKEIDQESWVNKMYERMNNVHRAR